MMKAYEKVPLEVFKWGMTKKGMLPKYFSVVQDIYEEIQTDVRTCRAVTQDF